MGFLSRIFGCREKQPTRDFVLGANGVHIRKGMRVKFAAGITASGSMKVVDIFPERNDMRIEYTDGGTMVVNADSYVPLSVRRVASRRVRRARGGSRK
jgi:hypothetical protein